MSKPEEETVIVEAKGKPAALPQIDEAYMIQKGIVLDVVEGRTLLSSTARKGNFGEMATDVDMVDKGWTPQHRRVTDIDAATAHGLDHIFSKPGPPKVTLIVDSKFGTAGLSTLADGTRQMSDRWIRDRLFDAIGRTNAIEILNNGYDSVVAKVALDGKLTYKLLDKNGRVVGTFLP